MLTLRGSIFAVGFHYIKQHYFSSKEKMTVALIVFLLLVSRDLLLLLHDQTAPLHVFVQPVIPNGTVETDQYDPSKIQDEYDKWLFSKETSYKCQGWPEYKKWIDNLILLAPRAPRCTDVNNFTKTYKITRFASPGLLVLQRNVKNADSTKRRHRNFTAFQLVAPLEALEGRMQIIVGLWVRANQERSLPPNLELLLYTNDKPRVARDLALPAFSISTEFSAGSGKPLQWKGYFPFPSHSHTKTILAPPRKFETKKPIVFFRGGFSETAWGRFRRQTSHEWKNTPRFKLANATRHESDKDVLDVKLTHISAGAADHHIHIWHSLQRDFNITKGEYIEFDVRDYRYLLSVSGNGWAGDTTIKALTGGSCMIFVNDTSIDNEGITRELGEIYFPFLRPGHDMIVVDDYTQIAATARRLNANPKRAQKISENGLRFVKQFLGTECVLDLIELLAWSYYRYVRTGCPEAFSHVNIE